ncbi:calcium-binding protein [Azospirillum agricola]|uniref:calcium-binding protein n=1 Tax=Azospirillum agricola TaxID=1720247 RepID=UPI000A0F0359|nr:calcium-binding protein [Azospirillum agricola]SMH62121.1 Hemolysin-type calcium-binding repeat-containing protein [Azospirillum lipoferum]
MTKYKYGTSGADTIFSDSQYYDLEATYVFGGAGNDSIFGGTGTDYLYGEDGNDYLDDHSGTGALFGGNGNDTLVAGIGHTTLNGGDGNDLFVFTNGSTGYFHLQGGAAADTDRIVALTSNTRIGLKSIANIDSIEGGGYGNVTIETYSDGGVFDFSNVTLTGIAAINGGSGSDTIIGSAGDDLIFGGWVGDDVLQGGAGNDTLKGDGGTVITGGIGADLFVCSASGLVVTDFNAAEGDRIGLPSGAAWTATDVAGGTQLVATFGTSSMRFMTLNGVTADQVQSSWFITAT